MTSRFERAMQRMRSHDPQVQEDGFQALLSHAGEYVEELISEFGREHDDHGLRCWLLELIAEARSPLALPILAQQLYGDDDSLRSWAVRGLEKLGTKSARQALWRARENGAVG